MIAERISLSARQSYEIGKLDTLRGIELFPNDGTDRAKTVQDWKALMLKACETCQDKAYAQGVKDALATID